MKRLLSILFVLGALGACSDDPVAPPGGPGAGPDTLGPLTAVPLSLGDHWTYDVSWTLRVLTTEREDFYPPDRRRADGVKEIVATEVLLGETWQVERECWRFETGDSVQSFRRYRQDESGLYRLFVDLSAPPGALEGIQEADEIMRLEFPLDVETGWTNLGGSRSRVEAKEMVQTATGEAEAYRISVTSHRDGENDFINVWFNEDGLVRRHNHFELNAIDIESGNHVIVVTDEIETLRKAPSR
jgi:hypothetical protein